MNRRFTLFALLIAACFLFASCGALTLSNHTGTLIIPLGTPGREAATLKFGQSYCERYEFTLYNKTTTLTATGTDSVIFPGIPAGTYSLKGKAFGILVDGKEHVIATSKNEGIVIAGSEEITIGISFYLEEIAFEDTQTPEGNVTYSVNPQTSTITMTVYQENSEIKVSETENQSDGTRIVREFSSSQGNQKTKETETKPDTTVIVTNYSNSSKKTSQTETKPNGTIIERTFDNSSSNYQTGETEKRTDGTIIETQFTSGKKSTQTETSPNDTVTVRTFDTTTSNNPLTIETQYQTGWNPAVTNTEPNSYHVARTVEYDYSGDSLASITTTEFEYEERKVFDENNAELVPFKGQTIITRSPSGEVLSTTSKTYTYTAAGKPENFSTVKDGVEIAYEKYTYKSGGTPNTVAILEEGKNTASYYSFMSIGLKVYSNSSSINTAVLETTNIIFESASNDTFFKCPCTQADFSDPDASKIPTEDIAKYLTDHYVLVGTSIAKSSSGTEDLHFITTDEISKTKKGATEFFPYIFKVNFDAFLSTTCFKKGSIVKDGDKFYLKCYLHNEKASCSNFWGSNYNFYSSQKIYKDTNYGCSTDSDYPGNNQGI